MDWPKPQKKWTKTEIEDVRRLRKNGVSCASIGIKYGVSRNSIIGLCHRNGVLVATPVGDPRGRINKLKNARIRAEAKRRIAKEKPTPLPPPHPDDIARVAGVLDLEKHHCRWPVDTAGGIGFCGDQNVDGSSYCASHAKRAGGFPQKYTEAIEAGRVGNPRLPVTKSALGKIYGKTPDREEIEALPA